MSAKASELAGIPSIAAVSIDGSAAIAACRIISECVAIVDVTLLIISFALIILTCPHGIGATQSVPVVRFPSVTSSASAER